jgi:signal transduction histidine kinase
MRRFNNQLHISVEDDSIGFYVDKIKSITLRTDNFVLFSINEQLENMGGYPDIKSKLVSGTKVTLIIPL